MIKNDFELGQAEYMLQKTGSKSLQEEIDAYIKSKAPRVYKDISVESFIAAVDRYFNHGEMDDWAASETVPIIRQYLEENRD